MGTRHLTAVMANGEYKIAQYGQWDGYPEGAGVKVLSFLRETNHDEFKKTLKDIRFITQDEMQEIIDKHTDDGYVSHEDENWRYWEDNLSHLDRNVGYKILWMVRDNKVSKLKNSIGFAGDSLFCEYAYVVDFDEGVFEIYEGFNKEPIHEGRFVSGDEALEKTNDYEPVKLVKTYSLDSLPSDEEFIEHLVPDSES